MPEENLAAICREKGCPLAVESRPIPEPGVGEILIKVKTVALNPIDHVQRDIGVAIPQFPVILGSDAAGVVVKVGPEVIDPPALGSRVMAFASCYYQNGSLDHGAFQKYALARYEGVIPLPDHYSFEEGAIIPLAALTALSGWTKIGFSLTPRSVPNTEAVLIWGASSSVGTLAVQSAKEMGFTIYATAGPHNHDYIKRLGAHVVFDYNASDAVLQIANAVKKDGVKLETAYCAAPNSLRPTLDVLKATMGSNGGKVAYAPPLFPDHPELDGVQIEFISLPTEATDRNRHIFDCFHGWLLGAISSKALIPSPKIQTEAGGLQGLDSALNTLKSGVSATKVVVNI